MFDLHGVDRLTEWKKFRDSLETASNPLEALSEFWSRAPFVSSYLNPNNPAEWPDPWHLILDNRLDNLAISLGMLYTLKLTNRFMNTSCEIHKSMSDDEKEDRFFLVVDGRFLLTGYSKEVIDLKKSEVKTMLVWTK